MKRRTVDEAIPGDFLALYPGFGGAPYHGIVVSRSPSPDTGTMQILVYWVESGSADEQLSTYDVEDLTQEIEDGMLREFVLIDTSGYDELSERRKRKLAKLESVLESLVADDGQEVVDDTFSVDG